jgi:hypothetical protein
MTRSTRLRLAYLSVFVGGAIGVAGCFLIQNRWWGVFLVEVLVLAGYLAGRKIIICGEKGDSTLSVEDDGGEKQ